jgi:hypothetical protein
MYRSYLSVNSALDWLGVGAGGQPPEKTWVLILREGVSASMYLSELTVRSIHRDRYTTSSQSPTTCHTGTGSILDQVRRDVCTQRIITTTTCKIFSHFQNKPYNYGITNILHIYVDNFSKNTQLSAL